MRRPRGLLLSGASLVGLVVVLAAHGLSGSGAPAALSGGSPATTTEPTTTTKPGTPTTSTAPPTTAGGSSSGTKTVTGQVVQYGYGEISVSLTVKSGHIVSAKVTKLATAENYSQQLAQEAIPTLDREVVSAQSAQIAAVSGATYTSQGYASSVQSALDALHNG